MGVLTCHCGPGALPIWIVRVTPGLQNLVTRRAGVIRWAGSIGAHQLEQPRHRVWETWRVAVYTLNAGGRRGAILDLSSHRRSLCDAVPRPTVTQVVIGQPGTESATRHNSNGLSAVRR